MDPLETSTNSVHLSVASSASPPLSPRSPFGASRRLDASHALSQSRAQSVQGARAATVGIQGFNNERAADFWLHKYGTPCPFFNALENVHVAPGSAGSGAGGSGAFALPPAGRSTTVGFGRGGVSSNQLRRASQTGAIAASSRALNAKSMKRKVGEEVKAGAKLTLYDPECRNQPIKVEKVTYKRREGKGDRREAWKGGGEVYPHESSYTFIYLHILSYTVIYPQMPLYTFIYTHILQNNQYYEYES